MIDLSSYIDHTALKTETSQETVHKLCDEALKYSFASVCINPSFVKTVSSRLSGSQVKTCTVVGFPLGATTTESKVYETENVLALGAQEIDMVINVGAAYDMNWALISKEISTISCSCIKSGALLKVILETCLLNRSQIIKACQIAVESGADFVKTSTGFSTSGADIESVKLMKETVGDKAQVKASGGIRTYEDAVAMINAGATRIGTSSGPGLLKPKNT
ncbi:MAG: deoxyribose-phosphate aldolase [Lentisphaeraceae bacterium]|nr:deoxyribose-phosphate aldolase [Lentisphaeraceae bacterium]